MFKVSFKKGSHKVQVVNNKSTIVTLVGSLNYPEYLWRITPTEIFDWIWHHSSVDVSHYFKADSLRIEVSGKSTCAEGDTFDSVLGERIAESRAKVRLYTFLYTLCRKMLNYYYPILYGNAESEFSENHMQAPKDCIHLTLEKYKRLWITEAHHLGELLYKA